MLSVRFSRPVVITKHAQSRMVERNISEAMLLELIETGTEKYKDPMHLWIYKSFAGRSDNLLCVAVVLENEVIVKTVMHHFQPGP